MIVWVEVREPDDPWHGRQPKYKRIVRLGPERFGLKTKLPSGVPITVPLGTLPLGRFGIPDVESS